MSAKTFNETNGCSSDKRRMPSREELGKLAGVDIRKIDISQLKDLEKVHIDRNLPKRERMADYIRQIGNPYCYRSHGIAVKISFVGKRTLEDCLCSCLPLDE
ncbi:MAG: hypothetical protein LUD12_16810 [Lachnospiraceae bacterium]|nr:hypothetical protein [Lachnospiraceae bacterium]